MSILGAFSCTYMKFSAAASMKQQKTLAGSSTYMVKFDSLHLLSPRRTVGSWVQGTCIKVSTICIALQKHQSPSFNSVNKEEARWDARKTIILTWQHWKWEIEKDTRTAYLGRFNEHTYISFLHLGKCMHCIERWGNDDARYIVLEQEFREDECCETQWTPRVSG